MGKKIDGVIEAVRCRNGQILMVRAYESRGATFSDLVLLDRKTLMERLQKGAHYLTGSRKALNASTFVLGKPVLIVKQADRELLVTDATATRDELEQVPAF